MSSAELTSIKQRMLGDNYFQTREKLESVVRDLSGLCSRVNVDPARVAMLNNLMANLKDPFLFVAVGEVNSGKSTLLNAIFGEDCCSTNVIPTTDQIVYFKYGREAHEFKFSEHILEVYRPNAFLRDFNLVDTPGTNSMHPHHQQITEYFLPAADLVLFVFSVTNPWGATTWDLLDRIHHQYRKKIVFVLQQCDLRTEEEVAAILDHLQKTAQHRFNRQFPTYPVSGKQAFTAKTRHLVPETLGKFCRIDNLERYISSVVETSETRLIKLIHAWRAASFVHGEIREQLATAIEIIRADDQLLGELEPAAEIQKTRTLKKCEPLFVAFDQSFMAAGLQAEPLLEAQFQLLSALIPSAKNAEEIESLIFAITMKAIRQGAASGASAVEEDVQHLFERVSNEMRDHYNLALSVGEGGMPDWSRSRELVTEAVERATASVLRQLDLKDELAVRFKTRCRLIWSYLGLAIVSSSGGVLLTLSKAGPWNFLAFALGLLCAISGMVLASKSVKGIRSFYHDILADMRERLAEAQRRAFGLAAGRFYADFVKLFEPLRGACQAHREAHEPEILDMGVCETKLAELEKILTPIDDMLEARKRTG